VEQTAIKGTSIKASRVGLGTYAMGGIMWGGSDKQESIRTVLAAFEQGINLVDTAPAYGAGLAEEVVGKVIAEHGDRESIIIATKVGLENREGWFYRNSTKEQIFKGIDESLKRLGTDYIDICQVHWPDPLVPIEETAEAMNKLYEQGKIRAIGVSNYSVEQMERFRKVSPLHTLQPPYNMFERVIEQDILPYCEKHGITMLTYGSLCRGLLSGRMRSDTQFSGDDHRKIDPKFKPPQYQEYLKTVELLDQFAQKNYGKHVLHLAVRWVLDRTNLAIALWGARRPDQMKTVGEVTGWSLDSKAMESIDSIINRHIKDTKQPYIADTYCPADRGPVKK
jgi:aryl-alcohol dehydrogenase-like predicted oxidoreductase